MEIKIAVKNKIAYSPVETIVCGNSGYKIVFDFDDEWSAYETKTARFIYNGIAVDKIFDGNICDVPIIKNATVCEVGVYAGNLATTTPALITCKKSILCKDGAPSDPPPDVYAQLMDKLNKSDPSGAVKTVNGKAPDENGNVDIPVGGEIDPETVEDAVNDYLKANPPAQGAAGKDGKDGYTPVKYVDYFTPEDVEEIAAQAAEMVEVPEGGSTDWIPIIDVTLEEAVTSVVADVDVNGNPFLVKEIMFVAKLLKGEVATAPYFAIGKPAISASGFKTDGCSWIVSSNLKNDFFCMGTVRLVGTKMRVVSSFLGKGENNMGGAGPYGSVLSGKEMGGNALSAISVGFTNIALKMPVGSIIKVWGR